MYVSAQPCCITTFHLNSPIIKGRCKPDMFSSKTAELDSRHIYYMSNLSHAKLAAECLLTFLCVEMNESSNIDIYIYIYILGGGAEAGTQEATN